MLIDPSDPTEALDIDPRFGSSVPVAGRWHLELDDLHGARIWLAQATLDGDEQAGAFSQADPDLAELSTASGKTSVRDDCALNRTGIWVDCRRN